MCLSREEVSSGIGLGRTFLIISTGVCRYGFALISVGSLAAFLLGFWGKRVVEKLTRHVDISFGFDRSPREGRAQSERGMDSQKPPGEDKDSEPAGE